MQQYTDDEIFDKLKEILHICMPDKDVSGLTRESVINRDLGVDSMSFIMVMAKVEPAFGITVPDERWDKLSTVQDVIDEVKLRLRLKAEDEAKKG